MNARIIDAIQLVLAGEKQTYVSALTGVARSTLWCHLKAYRRNDTLEAPKARAPKLTRAQYVARWRKLGDDARLDRTLGM